MTDRHGHDHVSAASSHRGRLVAVLAITVAVLVAEVVGGLLSGSLALLADAGHLLTDAVGIGIALGAVTLAHRPAPASRSYGNFRVEILAALVNGVLLLVVCAAVLVEVARRLGHPGHVEPVPMLVLGLLGLVANGVAIMMLREGQGVSLNVRGAYLEVLGDFIGSVAVLAAAVVIWASGWDRADVAASLVIAVLIVPRAIGLLREAVHVLFESTPPGVDLDDLRAHLAAVPGVVDVHDLHVWTITSGMPVLSAHVVVDPTAMVEACGGAGVLDQLCACVGDHFDVAHSTFQLEPAGHDAHEHAAHD
ncbi:MAG TPA: cation diffusion facilitator family transporter [Actinomycetes bacterium]